MKILLKLLSLLALLCPSASAYDAAQAEKIYGSGDFAQAAEAFAEQVRAQPDNPFAYYNLGNAQYKAGDTGAATASYYRAYLLLPRNADIRHNLQLALQKSGQNIVPPGVPESLHRLYTLFSVNELKALGWAMSWKEYAQLEKKPDLVISGDIDEIVADNSLYTITVIPPISLFAFIGMPRGFTSRIISARLCRSIPTPTPFSALAPRSIT